MDPLGRPSRPERFRLPADRRARRRSGHAVDILRRWPVWRAARHRSRRLNHRLGRGIAGERAGQSHCDYAHGGRSVRRDIWRRRLSLYGPARVILASIRLLLLVDLASPSRDRAATMTLKLVNSPGAEALANTAFTILSPLSIVVPQQLPCSRRQALRRARAQRLVNAN